MNTKHQKQFLKHKDKIQKSLAKDFENALGRMSPEDIKKLSWFVSNK